MSWGVITNLPFACIMTYVLDSNTELTLLVCWSCRWKIRRNAWCKWEIKYWQRVQVLPDMFNNNLKQMPYFLFRVCYIQCFSYIFFPIISNSLDVWCLYWMSSAYTINSTFWNKWYVKMEYQKFKIWQFRSDATNRQRGVMWLQLRSYISVISCKPTLRWFYFNLYASQWSTVPETHIGNKQWTVLNRL